MRSSVTYTHIKTFLDGLSPKEKTVEYDRSRTEKVPSLPRPVGEFLRTMVRAANPSNILDIGCGFGISTRYMAEGAPGASVTAIDLNAERIDAAVKLCGDCPSITFQAVDARTFLRQTRSRFDFVFVDVVKRLYPVVWHEMKPRLAENAVVVFDDVLFYGLVGQEDAEISHYHRPTVHDLRDFLVEIRTEFPTQTSILPVGDGVLVIAP